MPQKTTFFLPDLGEGLPDATIVKWFVQEGETIALDAPLVSVETAKAIIDVPSPVSGMVSKLAGQVGTTVQTGAMLAEFIADDAQHQRPMLQAQQHAFSETHHDAPTASSEQTDRAIVGTMDTAHTLTHQQAVVVNGVRAMPAVRALARKYKVDLSKIIPTGVDATVTVEDVEKAVKQHPHLQSNENKAPVKPSSDRETKISTRTIISASGKPVRTRSPTQENQIYGQPCTLRSVERNMARVMTDAHSKVVPTTLFEDAPIHLWDTNEDLTARLIRAIVAASASEPSLNAWFDDVHLTRTLHRHVDVGIAIDTEDGLFVPALRNADMLDKEGLRHAINRLREQTMARAIPPTEFKGYTISLSNFGMFAGRYATPIVVPPCVAIVAAGRTRHALYPVLGGIETRRIIPLSVTFDHRACTGGQAARFLRTLLEDLYQKE